MNYAIILASGSGRRFGSKIPKQFIKIAGKTILEYTLEKFENNEKTDRIILVTNADYLDFCRRLKFSKLFKIAEGGLQRQDSSRAGVNLVTEDNAKILIHDAARPFVTNELINKCYEALDSYFAVNTGVETSDTIIRVNNEGVIVDVPERKSLLACQTPQGFNSGLIKRAHALALDKKIEVTDDSGLIVALNLAEVFVVQGEIENIKITYPRDIKRAEEIFTRKV